MNTGFEELDKLVDLEKASLVVVGGISREDINAFGLSMLRNLSIKQNIPTLYFSLQMPKDTISMRTIISESMVNANDIRVEEELTEEWNRVIKATALVTNAPMYILDTDNTKINEICEICKKMQESRNIKAVIIDYYQFIKDIRSTNICEELRNLADKLNITIILLAKVSETVELKDDKKPTLDDLSFIKNIQLNANVIMTLYRDDFYNKNTTDKNIMQLSIVKSDFEKLGKIKLLAMLDYYKIDNMKLDVTEK